MQDTLMHYGIKGMKWGVRRTPAQLGHKTKNTSKKQRRAEVKSMSDAELRNRINRLQMEKQYMQLTEPEISPGKKFVKEVCNNAAKQTASTYVAQFMKKGIKYVDNQIRGNNL